MSAYFLLESFRMNFPLFHFPFRRWQDSMFSLPTSTSIPRNTPWILSSRALSLTNSEMPKTFRHFLYKYCSLTQHFRSATTKHSTKFTFTFLDSILVNLVFSSSNSTFIESRELSNLCWLPNKILANSSLVSFFRDEGEYTML